MLRKLSILMVLVSFLLMFGCKISGTVTEGGVGLQGVTVTLSGDANQTATTDGSGYYTFNFLMGGGYHVTPSKEGYIFEPDNIVVLKNFFFVDMPAVDFEAAAEEDCTDGDIEPCYTGPTGTSGVGECQDGTRTCASGAWGACEGEVTPVTEIPDDGIDQNCNGRDALPSDRFTDMGNGTVRDNDTGLIWLKDASALDSHTWYNATGTAPNVIADFNSGTEYNAEDYTAGTYADWRLPTRGEWLAFVDTTYSNPALSNAAGDGKWSEGDAFIGVQSGGYWSSTEVGPPSSWQVLVYVGGVGYDDKDRSYYVWPVRSGN